MNIFDQLRSGVATASAAETQALAAALARALPPDTTLALHGDLGAGKTTFVQGLARGFGIPRPVTSPTFTIFNLHRGPVLPGPASARLTLLHLDAYRLENPAQLDALMLDEFLVPPYCLAIEWPENIAGWLPASALHLQLGIQKDERHAIRLR
ncbi:MAG: tRNA (adenosine(37)-N6)-threonylcarbamoyltransferase complex ATPase subunit type 1 TsaE [Opitutaceae bacterium]|nr:tRNA (adenosine(37)-N6)-threonylcarbamoyltransferase complex ATPase subunit type 1 TsaE [Opitutaceae bacterium]